MVLIRGNGTIARVDRPMPSDRRTLMTTHGVLVGYDGSPDAAGAIELGARLLPGRDVRIAHLWAVPFATAELRPRVSRRTETVRQMIDLLEQEAEAEAERVAAEGVVLADAAGWKAELVLKRAYGAEGLELAALAEELEAEVLVVGSRGLTGPRAVLGSVSDQAAHASPVPTLVVPRLVLTTERDAAAKGPILVGDDGSPAAERARETATELFPGRDVATFTVEEAGTGRAVAEGLVRHALAIGAAAIVVGSRGRSAVRQIMLGSAAMAVLHHTDRPVVVVPGGRDRPAD
jgi:nucleotide-binding universal stress UspA family protein